MENPAISSCSPAWRRLSLEKQKEGKVMGRKKKKKKERHLEVCLYVLTELRLNLKEMESIFGFISFLARWGLFLTNVSYI